MTSAHGHARAAVLLCLHRGVGSGPPECPRCAELEHQRVGAACNPRAREVQLAMAASGDHRRVPPPDLLIAATAELANVPLVHYDRDYERIAAVTAQEHAWFVPDGAITETS
jgi:hypothetical protein